jgi:hypothetical protein
MLYSKKKKFVFAEKSAQKLVSQIANPQITKKIASANLQSATFAEVSQI